MIMKINLQARAALKATIVLDAAALAAVEVPNGTPRVTLSVSIGSRAVQGSVSGKGLRKVVALIRESGADRVAVVLSGRLEAGDILAEAGIVAQPKTPKPAGGGQ
jgi:hypothetical protein